MSTANTQSNPRERILNHAHELFMRRGVRSVTMDDIASGLGMSKKTVYQHYSNKADLVAAVIESTCHRLSAQEEAVAWSAQNAIDELVNMIRIFTHQLSTMSPSAIYEIRRYYPEAWKIFESYEQENILGRIRANLERGMREGLYRDDLQVEIVARLRMAQINIGFMNELFPLDRFSPLEVQREGLKSFIYSIVNEEGRAAIEPFFAELTNNPSTP